MINPELEPFLEVWNKSWTVLPAKATPAERRLLFEYIAQSMALPRPDGIVTSTAFVPCEKRNVLLRIDRYGQGDEIQPCLVYMHGGAWMQGSPMTHADITMRIAATNRQTVVSIDYAKAPEHPFPQAANECRDAVKWVKDNAEALKVDATRIAVGGDSAGGNLSASVTLALRGTDYAPMAQLLIYPGVDFDMDKPSYIENADAPLLNVHGMNAVNNNYCPDLKERTNPLAAPLKAESHADLPPAFVAVAQNDPLRDDGYAYAEKLRADGVPVEFDSGEGLIHGYLRAMEYCADSRAKLAAMCNWLAGRYANV